MSEIITIDGPASSGKSTVGFLFAQKIGYQFIDSGLIYRIGTLIALRENVSIEDEEKCADILTKADIQFKTLDGKVHVFLNDEDVTAFLKTPEIDRAVPIFAVHRKVQEATKDIEKKVAFGQDTVMAGRNIGAESFPQSPLKFFVTASVLSRANRRYDQQVKDHPDVKIEDIAEEISKRDEKDSTREAYPMKVPTDAIVIDTSNLTIDEVVAEMFKLYTNKNLQPH